jgi:hypothetical protein
MVEVFMLKMCKVFRQFEPGRSALSGRDGPDQLGRFANSHVKKSDMVDRARRVAPIRRQLRPRAA